MIIKVNAKPNSSFEGIKKIAEGGYLVNVKDKAENNKANISVIRLLANEFGVYFKNIKIKNKNSRKKIVEII
jgi:uncharacterized protein YggU (UPF0235/DUF167 family)